MKRNIIVGVAAAVTGMLLMSLFLSLEMRYSENGALMRELAANGRPGVSFDHVMTVMNKWVHIHEFVYSPTISIFVGLFVGLLCRNRYWLALVIGLTPIRLVHYPSDLFSVLSALVCISGAWLGAKSAQAMIAHFSIPQTDATT